jgi:ATP-binding protein involved in chromosome partitioning
MYTKDQILEVLANVIYPGEKDIVTMGMVESVDSGGEGIKIVLLTTKAKDPIINSLKHACVKALKDKFGPDTTVLDIAVNAPEPAQAPPKQITKILPDVKNVIAIASGKGGVGKSTVSVNTAVALARKGYSVGLLDADIFGPSAPKMFNAEDFHPEVKKENGREMVIPLEKYGVKVLSVGFFVDPAEAIVWRGPMASNFLKQMIEQGDWGALDYLLIDLPPGTSDIHLTMVQELGVTGALIVSTPQDVALADAIKGISMFTTEKINVPVLGLIENMAWFTPAELPDNKYYIFGKGGCEKLAKERNIPLLGQIPLEQGLCESGDNGTPLGLGDSPTGVSFGELAEKLVEITEARNKNLEPTKKVNIN